MKNNYKNLKTGDVIVITDMMNQTLISIYKGIRKSPISKTTEVTDFCSCTVEEDSLSDVFFVRDNEDLTGWIENLNFVGMADEKQKGYFYRNVLDIYCDEHPDFDKYFTDSTFNEIQDWFAYKCCVEFGDDGYPDFIYDFTNFAWYILCKQMNPDNPKDVKSELTGEELLIAWFNKIERMASERTTEVGFVMDEKTALNEICILARDAAEFVKRYMDVRMD